jgi:hypothetical protein
MLFELIVIFAVLEFISVRCEFSVLEFAVMFVEFVFIKFEFVSIKFELEFIFPSFVRMSYCI